MSLTGIDGRVYTLIIYLLTCFDCTLALIYLIFFNVFLLNLFLNKTNFNYINFCDPYDITALIMANITLTKTYLSNRTSIYLINELLYIGYSQMSFSNVTRKRKSGVKHRL